MLTDLLIGCLIASGAVLLSLAAYFAARAVSRSHQYERHREMAIVMVTRIAALHALILALVFAQEMAAYQRLDNQTAIEADAVADVFNDAARYGPELQSVQDDMRAYLDIVIGTEWIELGEGRGLSQPAWDVWDRAYETVLDVDAQTPRQQHLRDHILQSLHEISDARSIRQNEAVVTIANYFWIAALTGVVLIAVGHYIYPPEPQNLVMLALFSAYTGAILFLIYGFSNPYSPPAALAPAPLEYIQQRIATP
jgi:hypothetical protein